MNKTQTEIGLDILGSVLKIHRDRSVITCQEDCICWDIETLINKYEMIMTGAYDESDRSASQCVMNKQDEIVETPQEKLVRQYQLMVDTGSEPVAQWKKLLAEAKAKLDESPDATEDND